MKVSDCMTWAVQLIGPEETIQDAALIMCEIDAGALPVGDDARLLGMITDRDIAVRAVAMGLGPDCKVADVMSREILYCFADEDIDDVLRNMGDVKVRRLPVMDRQKRLVGIVSLSDMTIGGARPPMAKALEQIAIPGGPHSQALH